MATFKDFEKQLRAAVDKTFSAKSMKGYGDLSVDLVRKRTFQGYGVPKEGAARQKLKPLAPSTIEKRRRNENLSPYTSPAKSHLIETGQMLLSVRTTEFRKGSAVIGPTGGRAEGDQSNSDVAGYVTEQGRPFLHLSDREQKKVAQAIDATLQQELKRI